MRAFDKMRAPFLLYSEKRKDVVKMDKRKEDKDFGADLASFIKNAAYGAFEAFKTRDYRKIGRKLLVSLAAFLFARGPWLFGAYPFGIALLSAADRDLPFIAAGCAVGAFFTSGTNGVLFALLYAALFAVRALGIAAKKRKRSPDMPTERGDIGMRVALSVIAASVGGTYVCFLEAFSLHSLFALLFVLSVSGVLTFLYCGAFSGVRAHVIHKKAAYCALLFSLVYSVSSLSLFGFSPDVMLSAFILLVLHPRLDVLSCGALGLILGTACGREYVIVLALLGAVSALFHKYSKRLAPWFGVLSGFAWAFYAQGTSAFLYVLPDLVGGLVCSLPVGLYLGNRSLSGQKETLAASGAAKDEVFDLDARLADLSKDAQALSLSLRDPAPEQIERIVETEIEENCRGCAFECFEKGEKKERLIKELQKRGFTESEHADFAELPFCSKRQLLCDGIGRAYAERAARQRENDRLLAFSECFDGTSLIMRDRQRTFEDARSENKEALERFKKLLHDLSLPCDSLSVTGIRKTVFKAEGLDETALTESAEQIQKAFESDGGRVSLPILRREEKGYSLTMRALCAFKVSHTFASAAKSGEAENGDAVLFFTFDDYFYAVLCDGMGSGHDANVVSNASTAFLRDLILCGASPASALEILNRLLLAMNRECPCTVDLFRLDLFSGDGAFYKCGACPSLVLRKDNAFKIAFPSIPLGGAREARYEAIRVRLKPFDRVILWSDGVSIEPEASPWLSDLLSGGLGATPGEISSSILARADSENGQDDDRTLIVLEVLREDGAP